MYYSAIIDNTALVDLTRLHGTRSFFDRLRNIFHTLYVPMEVKNEYAVGVPFEPNRNWLLDRLNPEQGFFRLCTSYDSFAKIVVEGHKGIDKGEAESYVQCKKIEAQVIISDDQAFTKALQSLDPYIQVYNTLHLLCWLEILSFLGDWNGTIKTIHAARPFSSGDLRSAYRTMLEKFGISQTNKVISEKCNLSKILL